MLQQLKPDSGPMQITPPSTCASSTCACSLQQNIGRLDWGSAQSDYAVVALRLMPNNYGTASHDMIRVRNACNQDIEVAIFFYYYSDGAPLDCKYLAM